MIDKTAVVSPSERAIETPPRSVTQASLCLVGGKRIVQKALAQFPKSKMADFVQWKVSELKG